MSAHEEERRARIGKNEAVFRAVNEKIEELNLAFGEITDRLQLVCECGDATCADTIELTVQSYERLRADPTMFAVVPGHELTEAEQVVERHEGFFVVQKNLGVPERIARQTDPRKAEDSNAS